MKKIKKFFLFLVGGILIVFGGYLEVMRHLIEKEITNLEQGSSVTSNFVEFASYPFIRKDVVIYNANLDKIESMDKIRSVLENLHKILNESTNPEIRFRTSLLLAHIYSSFFQEENAKKGLPIAIEMYIQALKIKPDDRFAKLALEKLLDHAQRSPSKQVKKQIHQAKPDENGEKWTIDDKGDDI